MKGTLIFSHEWLRRGEVKIFPMSGEAANGELLSHEWENINVP